MIITNRCHEKRNFQERLHKYTNNFHVQPWYVLIGVQAENSFLWVYNSKRFLSSLKNMIEIVEILEKIIKMGKYFYQSVLKSNLNNELDVLAPDWPENKYIESWTTTKGELQTVDGCSPVCSCTDHAAFGPVLSGIDHMSLRRQFPS